jgi:AcrR family transcriptional regulator
MFGNYMKTQTPLSADITNSSSQKGTEAPAQEKSTRDLILDAAFSFYNRPRYTDFSLSEVAEKVGISKAAIFRHFENKDKLLDAMRERLIDRIYEQAEIVRKSFDQKKNASSSDQNVCGNAEEVTLMPIAPALEYFASHPEYSFYLVGQFLSSPDFEATIARGCEQRGFGTNRRIYSPCDHGEKMMVNDRSKYIAIIYVSVSLFFFLQLRFKKIDEGIAVPDAKTFSRKVVSFIERGLAESFSKDTMRYPQPIEESRFAEFDSYCSIDKAQLPEEDRIFTALASVIRKNQFAGVTVQKIADELHMAKSSLYSYFNNKNELIRSLIEKEIHVMTKLIHENTKISRTVFEHIYMTMRIELAYFMNRPSLISVCGWLRMSGSYYENETDFVEGGAEKTHGLDDYDRKTDGTCCGPDEDKIQWFREMHTPLTEPDIGMPLITGELAMWVSSLPVTLLLQGRNHGMSDNDLFNSLRQIFTYIEYGINISAL